MRALFILTMFGFAIGCVDTDSATQPADEVSVQSETESVTQIEQGLGATTSAQERLITYFAEPTHVTVVGACFGPYRCFGPKGLSCWGRKTVHTDVDWFDCPEEEPLP